MKRAVGSLLWKTCLSLFLTLGCGEDLVPGPPVFTGGSGGGGGQIGPGTGGTDPVVCVPNAGSAGGPGGGGSGGAPQGTCGGVVCGLRQECQTSDDGGMMCVDVLCDADEQCAEASYCGEDGRCIDDACVPGVARCEGSQVFVCSSNGAEETALFECTGNAHFESSCETAETGAVGCTCEDDWDCPEFTECDAGTCVGTGQAATCRLDPVPFEEVLPSLEFHWGGDDSANPASSGSPFPESAQVTSTPIVANLDDDNGDGLINELDFPEILFMTYHTTDAGAFGVVRAVHGGGSEKGEDYFALCGTTHWPQDGAADEVSCGTDLDEADARPAGALAVGDLDYDGVPEIVVPRMDGSLAILDNEGQIRTTSEEALWPAYQTPLDFWIAPAPAIANLDFDGLAEIVVGNRVLTLELDGDDLSVADVFTGEGRVGVQDAIATENYQLYFGPVVCVADLTETGEDRPGLEIVAGTTAYRLPAPPSGVTRRSDCENADTGDFCEGRLSQVWDAQETNGGASIPDALAEGFCAVADVLGEDVDAAPGPDNPLDGVPEVVVVATGYLIILGAEDGERLRYMDVDDLVPNEAAELPNSTRGGAPNIDDFDGDGFPEIATALQSFYAVIDLQDPQAEFCPAWSRMLGATELPPGPLANSPRLPGTECSEDGDCASGTCDPSGMCSCSEDSECNAGAVCNLVNGLCTCLHNGWIRATEDDSSKASSSSVFDFNGDGSAEVVYADECYFRVYDGATGRVWMAEPSISRTIVENPVVADVDNDGNAEIISVSNNETIQCQGVAQPVTEPVADLPNGIDVWGDASDTWVSARRVWNQHSYHVTNVTESGGIPLHEPESWLAHGDRLNNTYRSQPRSYGAAPDLTITGMQVSSPGSACGTLSDEIVIVVSIKNQGDSRVGPGVDVSFYGIWSDPELEEPLADENGDPIVVTLDKSLPPGAVTFVEITFNAENGTPGTPPESIRAFVDSGEIERECLEDNNEFTGLESVDTVADLRLTFDGATGCRPPSVTVTVVNDGAAPASDVLVRIYAGDPSQGGIAIGETTIDGPIAPGESVTVTFDVGVLERDVVLYGVADPQGAVPECNEANNVAMGPRLLCEPVPE